MKIKDLLKKGALTLGDRKTALLDSEILLSYILGLEKKDLLIESNQEIDESLERLFSQYIDRVKQGEPVSYITCLKEFYGLDFFVDKRVLVPRPETEQLVDRVLDYLHKNSDEKKEFRILDVGTGCGNIAVSIAKNFNGVNILALDVDEFALEVARINVSQHSLEDKIRLCCSDLLECVEDEEKFDIIVANLPYIGEIKNRFIAADVEKYEPKTALFGGEDGLRLYERMFKQIRDKKISYGIIVGEFGFAQREDMEKLLNKYFAQEWRIEKDLADIDRIFIIEK